MVHPSHGDWYTLAELKKKMGGADAMGGEWGAGKWIDVTDIAMLASFFIDTGASSTFPAFVIWNDEKVLFKLHEGALHKAFTRNMDHNIYKKQNYDIYVSSASITDAKATAHGGTATPEQLQSISNPNAGKNIKKGSYAAIECDDIGGDNIGGGWDVAREDRGEVANTLKECEKAATDNASALGFVWGEKEKKCWIKGTIGELEKGKNNRNYYIKKEHLDVADSNGIWTSSCKKVD